MEKYTLDDVISLAEQLDGWILKNNSGMPVPESEIVDIEEKLGFILCEPYKEFLRRFGYLEGITYDYIGYVAGYGHGSGTVVGETLEFQSKFDHLPNTTVFANESDEWYVLIDHSNGIVKTFDPFGKTYQGSTPLIEFLVANACEQKNAELKFNEKQGSD